eukprot:TRINITY_DN1843_c0_g1_i2.p1 TRINITY_DN1843_c0_g1~~TRINITY_DN1843_c0_g1_i2.p1  ORF type:complete len:350 (-),score=50.68 TRINITY_DN1843_c0_g1_i2:22-1071(-)
MSGYPPWGENNPNGYPPQNVYSSPIPPQYSSLEASYVYPAYSFQTETSTALPSYTYTAPVSFPSTTPHPHPHSQPNLYGPGSVYETYQQSQQNVLPPTYGVSQTVAPSLTTYGTTHTSYAAPQTNPSNYGYDRSIYNTDIGTPYSQTRSVSYAPTIYQETHQTTNPPAYNIASAPNSSYNTIPYTSSVNPTPHSFIRSDTYQAPSPAYSNYYTSNQIPSHNTMGSIPPVQRSNTSFVTPTYSVFDYRSTDQNNTILRTVSTLADPVHQSNVNLPNLNLDTSAEKVRLERLAEETKKQEQDKINQEQEKQLELQKKEERKQIEQQRIIEEQKAQAEQRIREEQRLSLIHI